MRPSQSRAAAGARAQPTSLESSSSNATKAQAVTEACDDDGALRAAMSARPAQSAQADQRRGIAVLTMRSPRARRLARGPRRSMCSGVFDAATQAPPRRAGPPRRGRPTSRGTSSALRAASRKAELGGKRAAKRRATSRAAVATAASPSLISSTQTSAAMRRRCSIAGPAAAQPVQAPPVRVDADIRSGHAPQLDQ